MKICIIAEGSYPYITGGVSSWINMIITNMPEHEFLIYTIFPSEKDSGSFKYEIPQNISGITEVFLDSWEKEPSKARKSLKFTAAEKKVIIQLITGQSFDWTLLFNIVKQKKVDNVQDFLQSKDFFDIVQTAYIEAYAQTPFTEFFWTIRSMLLPLFHIIRHPIPEADLYHCPSTGYAGIVGSLAKLIHHKPLIMTEHGIYTREREIEILKATWMKSYYKEMWIEFFYNMSRCSYQYADRVYTLFNHNMEVQKIIGCPEEKLQIIPNGVDVDRFSSLPKRSFMEDGTLVIGAIVRVVPIKDIKTLIQGFAVVKEQMANAELLIIGPTEEDEAYYQECMQLIEDFKLKDVVFTGRQDVRQLIPKVDLFVLSSISEGQPLSVLEVMAAGKVNITTDVGCCKELLLDVNGDGLGKAGVIVPVMDYFGLGNAILEMSKKPDLIKHYGENGFNRVSAFYRIDQMIEAYKRAYLEAGENKWQA